MFRARDTRLNRDVAIKVLPPLFADDPDRLARFGREAQTLAALNHPNIAQIHGLEESQGPGSGVRALVMELVEGEDLSAIIGRGRGCQSQTRCRSHGRSPMRSKRRTTSASSIAT